MLEISCFLGITIYMDLQAHPTPQFYAEYGHYHVTIEIGSGVVSGTFPRRALLAVLDWYVLHQAALLANWHAAQNRQPLSRIDPLE